MTKGGPRTDGDADRLDGEAVEASPGRPLTVALLAAASLVSAAVIAVFWWATRALDLPFSYVSREPQTAEPGAIKWYAGSLSNLGVLVSGSAAAAALVVAAGMHAARRSDRRAPVLWWGGGLLAAMTVDDLFLLHENLYAEALPEALLSPAYGVPAIVLLVRYRSVLAVEAGALYVVGGGALLVSVTTSELWAGHHVIEDGFKLFGYVLWAAFFVRLSIRCIGVTGGVGPSPETSRT